MRYLIFLLAACSAWGQTALTSSIGYPISFPASLPDIQFSLQAMTTINGSGIKNAHCGYLNIPGFTAAKTLQNLHFQFGAITKTNGSTLTVGLQASSATTGPTIQPDGTYLAGGAAFASISNASIPASNTWFRSSTVGGTLSMSQGDLVCIVIEPDSYVAGDSFVVRGMLFTSPLNSFSVNYSASAWAASSTTIMFSLVEFTDGTFGSIGNSMPLNHGSLMTATTFNSGSTPDEIALKISPNTSIRVVGMCADNPYSTAGGDLEFVLYSGTTAQLTLAIDAQRLTNSSARQYCALFSSSYTMVAGGTYYAALKPTTTNNIRMAPVLINSDGYASVIGGGTSVSYSARTDAGAWSDTTTTRPLIWLLIDAVGSSASTGGSFVVAQ